MPSLYPLIEGQGFSFDEPFGQAQRGQVLELVVALHRVPVTAIRTTAEDEFDLLAIIDFHSEAVEAW